MKTITINFICLYFLILIFTGTACKRDKVVTTREKEGYSGKVATGENENLRAQSEMQDQMLGQVIREAALNGDLSSLRQLTEAGVDINLSDDDGRTPLMFAAFNGHHEIVAFLLEKGAFVDMHDAFNRTALLYAATGPFPQTVELLLKNDADPNVVDSDEHFTPLMHAAAEGNIEVVRVLLEHGARKDLTDVDGDNALSFARENGHDKVVSLLEKVK